MVRPGSGSHPLGVNHSYMTWKGGWAGSPKENMELFPEQRGLLIGPEQLQSLYWPDFEVWLTLIILPDYLLVCWYFSGE